MKGLVVFLSVAVTVISGTTVLTRHGHDLLPSSTLRWKHVVKANLKHAIQVDPNEWNSIEADKIRYVCRSLHHGQWIPGYMEKGICNIPWKGMEHGYSDHEVLIGIQSSARMKWMRWTANKPLPPLTVSTGSYYITRHWDDVTERYAIGELSKRNNAAHAFLRGKVNNTLHEGYILTEIEPEKYELQEFHAPTSSWENVSTAPIELASTQLINPHKKEGVAYTTVAYRFTDIIEMKRLPGMKPGLMASFKMGQHADGDVEETHVHNILDGRNFIIGLELFHDHGEETVVTAQIPAESKINITLLANYQTYHIPYKAIVKAYYRDGHSLTWKGKGSITFQTLEGMYQSVADPEPATEEDLALEQTHVQFSSFIEPPTTTPQVYTTQPELQATTTKAVEDVVEEVSGAPGKEVALELRMLNLEEEPSKPPKKYLPIMSIEEFFKRI